VPDIVAAVLAQMLAKRPDDRFQTPLDLIPALTSCIDQLGLARPTVGLPTYSASWLPPTTWWRHHAAWLVPTVLLLVTIFILAIAWRSETTTPAFTELNLPSKVESGIEADGKTDSKTNEAPDG
jgi:hypothetical protein